MVRTDGVASFDPLASGGAVDTLEQDREEVAATESAAREAVSPTTELPGLLATGLFPPRSAAAPRVAAVVWRRGHQSPRWRMWRRIAVDAGRGVLLVLLLNLFVLQISIVRGHSMEPCLHDGDRLVVDRLVYALSDVDRFDVVVLRYPRDPQMDFVKRIVGLPGETIEIADGRVLVNGSALREAFTFVPDHADMRPVVVPAGHYFVLGDNRPVSCDSRDFGLVEAAFLRGKVRARFWPPARFGAL